MFVFSNILHNQNDSALLLTDGSHAKISKKDFPDINAISGALKLYLRQLPIPLVPFDIFGAFMDAVRKCLLFPADHIYRQLFVIFALLFVGWLQDGPFVCACICVCAGERQAFVCVYGYV